MVRSAGSKYGFWLAGYYEDFLGSRVITDDANAPSTDSAYDATKTHHGNTMNGEATLNPRYRWSVRDRQATEFASSTNYLLTNDGVHRWATFDHIRLGKGATWVGRSQLQYPSTLAHPNRLRFDDTPHNTASTDDTYMIISSSSDSSAKYYLPGGDTDASFGRRNHYAFNGKSYESGEAGNTVGTQPNFMQYAHMTGVWMGERLQAGAYNGSDGSATAHVNFPERHFQPIKSLAGKPFLCVTTYLADSTAHQLDNVTPAGAYRPVIAYSNPLNSRSTGDYFTLRMATHAMKGMYTGSAPTQGTATDIDTSAQIKYTLKIGFPANTTWGTTGSGGGTAAIEWAFTPHDGAGLAGVVPYYHMLWDAQGQAGQQDLEAAASQIWQDFDFKFIGSNKFKVYHNGTEVTTTNTAAGSYSGGYTLKNNTQTSAAFNQDELTGWELFVEPNHANYNKCLVDTMIDRVALYRPLTDMPDGTALPAPVNSWDCDMTVDGISQASITVLDDDNEQNLTPWFTNDNISDWRLLMFSGGIDRPLWNGVIDKISIKQSPNKRTRELTISARDSLSLLDRQIAAWEVGQIGMGEDDVVLARKNEVAGLSDAMFLGAAKLQSSLPTIGFESATSYKELHHQRMRLNTAHPIQMYNNEDVRGPNDIENEWLGYKIKGFNNPTGTLASAIMERSSTGYSDGDTFTVMGSDSHNVTAGTLAVGAVSTAHNTASNGYFGNDAGTQWYTGITANTLQEIVLPGVTYQKNTTATMEGYTSYDPRSTASGSTAQHTGYLIYRFSTQPSRADGSTLKPGDYITIAEKGNSSKINGCFKVIATETYLGKYYVKTDFIANTTAFTSAAMDFSIDTGFARPAALDLKMRVAHAVWMRQLADSPWFRKHFAVYEPIFKDSLLTDGAITASATQIAYTGSMNGNSGVGQIVDSDGFIDTFTFTGNLDSQNTIVGVSGLSKDHADDSTMYILDVKEDYKHIWLQWADMRNNGDADANGGFAKKEVGLIKPVAENYDVSIAFTDQYEDDGSFTDFTDLKVGSDLDMWELDAEIDPSTGIPWSTPIGTGGAKLIINNGDNLAINGPIHSSYQSGAYTGKAFFRCDDDNVPSVGDKILLSGCGVYNGTQTVSFVENELGDNSLVVIAIDHTVDITYANYPFFIVLQAENTESVLRSWENTGGSLVVYDCSKFFNLNTFINGGTINQESGGRVNIGDYETEYHGFPVLMDNYWIQGSATRDNISKPYAEHPNYRLWNGATAELNRTIEVGDTVIETKSSTSLISEFGINGFGKIKASRNMNGQNPSSEPFWYSWDGKLDSSVVETATSTTANASSMVITCNGGSVDFLVDGVRPGMRVRNVTQKWVAIITAVTDKTITISNTTLANETGGTTQTVAINDTISIPQQLHGVYIEPDTGRNFTAEQAETFLQGIIMNDVVKSQGSTIPIAVNAQASQNATGAFDQVVVIASVSPRYALRFLMKVDGFITSPNIGTYWFSDKTRFLWSFMLSSTWLAQASVPCWYDIGSIPLTNNMTIDGGNSNHDSFGSAADMRGGKSILSIIKQSKESTGYGYYNSLRLPMTYQIGRDNKLEVRPSYNSGEVINRSILSVSSMDAEMGSHITNVRVYYNNGISFTDFPAPTLNQTYRWKIVEMPEVTSEAEADAIAKEQYHRAKKKSISITGNILKDTTFTDKMLDQGRYGYVADPYRHTERGVVGNIIFNTSNNDVHSPSVDRNGIWCAVNGIMFCGTQNALDGHMGTDGTDEFNRDRYGAGITSQGTSPAQAVSYDNNFYWWGANSLAYAVQIVHIPTKTPLTSMTDNSDDLRIWIALKDGQSGTDIDNAEFTVGLSNPVFVQDPQAVFTTDYSTTAQFSPRMEVASVTTTTVDVKRNGFYEIAIPGTYWTDATGNERIVISVNVDYLKDILRHRCGDPTSSSILHNAHHITDATGVSNFSNTNNSSLFPLGLRQYSNMTGAFDYRNAWYCPRVNIVADLRWRPATTVAYTDSGLGLSSEALCIKKIKWSATGSSIEDIQLSLERDQTKDDGGLSSFLFPTVSRGRGSPTVGGGGGGGNTPPAPTPDAPGGSGGGTGGGTIDPYLPPTSGPIGSTPFTPSQVEGGRLTLVGGGAFSDSVTGNMMASGLHARVSGRMDLLENGVSGASFGLLGQARSAPPLNTQRSVEGIGDTLFAGSATSTMSSEGMVFSGIVDPESSNRPTQSHSMSVRVPDDVSDEIITIDCSYSLGGTEDKRAILDITAACRETGSSITRTITFGGNNEQQSMALLSGNLNGAETGGNNISITLTRTSGSGDDDSSYSSLVLHNVRVNFQRFSMKGFSTSSQGFTPY